MHHRALRRAPLDSFDLFHFRLDFIVHDSFQCEKLHLDMFQHKRNSRKKYLACSKKPQFHGPANDISPRA